MALLLELIGQAADLRLVVQRRNAAWDPVVGLRDPVALPFQARAAPPSAYCGGQRALT